MKHLLQWWLTSAKAPTSLRVRKVKVGMEGFYAHNGCFSRCSPLAMKPLWLGYHPATQYANTICTSGSWASQEPRGQTRGRELAEGSVFQCPGCTAMVMGKLAMEPGEGFSTPSVATTLLSAELWETLKTACQERRKMLLPALPWSLNGLMDKRRKRAVTLQTRTLHSFILELCSSFL